MNTSLRAHLGGSDAAGGDAAGAVVHDLDHLVPGWQFNGIQIIWVIFWTIFLRDFLANILLPSEAHITVHVQGDSGGRVPWLGCRFGEFPRLVGQYCSYLLATAQAGW